MKVTGYMLRAAIERWERRRDLAADSFKDSLYKFEDENKESPQTLSNNFIHAEACIAAIQRSQAKYNLMVGVTVEGKLYTLLEVIKLIGGAGRVAGMWKNAANPKKDRYSYGSDSMERDQDKERAKATFTKTEAIHMADVLAAKSAFMRAAISTGNAQEIDAAAIDLDPKLLTE